MDELLAELLRVRGVESAAVVAEDGRVMASSGTGPDPALPLAGAMASALAVRSLFGQLLDGDAVKGITVDYSGGPVMITPFAGGEGGLALVTRLASMADLGRARLAVRRLLPRLAGIVRP